MTQVRRFCLNRHSLAEVVTTVAGNVGAMRLVLRFYYDDGSRKNQNGNCDRLELENVGVVCCPRQVGGSERPVSSSETEH